MSLWQNQMSNLKSSVTKSIDVSEYSDSFDKGLLARIGRAIEKELPGTEIKIDEAKLDVEQHQDFSPRNYSLGMRIRITAKEFWPFCERRGIRKPVRRIETSG